jgi:hypothetical protein
METARKESLVRQIAAKHPGLTIRTSWSMGDWDHIGIAIRAINASAGCVLYADKDDSTLDAMTDADVLAWVAQTVKDHGRRCKQSHHRRAVERQMDRE